MMQPACRPRANTVMTPLELVPDSIRWRMANRRRRSSGGTRSSSSSSRTSAHKPDSQFPLVEASASRLVPLSCRAPRRWRPAPHSPGQADLHGRAVRTPPPAVHLSQSISPRASPTALHGRDLTGSAARLCMHICVAGSAARLSQSRRACLCSQPSAAVSSSTVDRARFCGRRSSSVAFGTQYICSPCATLCGSDPDLSASLSPLSSYLPWKSTPFPSRPPCADLYAVCSAQSHQLRLLVEWVDL